MTMTLKLTTKKPRDQPARGDQLHLVQDPQKLALRLVALVARKLTSLDELVVGIVLVQALVLKLALVDELMEGAMVAERALALLDEVVEGVGLLASLG